MKKVLVLALMLLSGACSTASEEAKITNAKILNYPFLSEMYSDSYFPRHLVDEGKSILLELCAEIEKNKPTTPADVYKLTHAATIRFNELAVDFGKSGSELETGARENIGKDIDFILKAYGYNLDIEEAIAPREW